MTKESYSTMIKEKLEDFKAEMKKWLLEELMEAEFTGLTAVKKGKTTYLG